MVLLILSFAMRILNRDVTADTLSDNNSFSSILNFSSGYIHIYCSIHIFASPYTCILSEIDVCSFFDE